MKLTNIGSFDNIDRFVSYKIEEYRKREKTLETLFEFMFSESDNIMAEISDGYRIKKVTYGQFKFGCAAGQPYRSLSGQLHGLDTHILGDSGVRIPPASHEHEPAFRRA